LSGYAIIYRKKKVAMLVVTRRPGEAIVIELPTGELIEVVVLGTEANHVKLGTDAPDDILVLREELLERVET
jgi:carbon storage regulator